MWSHPSPAITGKSRRKDQNAEGKVICVTCPQGWAGSRDMRTGPFADIPELKDIRDQWAADGWKRVPMNITPENRVKLESVMFRLSRHHSLFGPSFSMRLHLGQVTSLDIAAKTWIDVHRHIRLLGMCFDGRGCGRYSRTSSPGNGGDGTRAGYGLGNQEQPSANLFRSHKRGQIC